MRVLPDFFGEMFSRAERAPRPAKAIKNSLFFNG